MPQPQPRSRNGWSNAQRVGLHKACAAAGWTPATRYLAMRHAGCPLTQDGRPSVTHPGNTQAAYERVMELAEAAAAQAGRPIRTAAHGRTWAQVVASGQRERMTRHAQQIAAEGIRRLPSRFDAGLLDYAIRHTTAHDAESLPIDPRPESIDRCDAGQLYRVIEMLRAMVGRELLAAGIKPESFVAPPSAALRASRSPRILPTPRSDTAGAA